MKSISELLLGFAGTMILSVGNPTGNAPLGAASSASSIHC